MPATAEALNPTNTSSETNPDEKYIKEALGLTTRINFDTMQPGQKAMIAKYLDESKISNAPMLGAPKLSDFYRLSMNDAYAKCVNWATANPEEAEAALAQYLKNFDLISSSKPINIQGFLSKAPPKQPSTRFGSDKETSSKVPVSSRRSFPSQPVRVSRADKIRAKAARRLQQKGENFIYMANLHPHAIQQLLGTFSYNRLANYHHYLVTDPHIIMAHEYASTAAPGTASQAYKFFYENGAHKIDPENLPALREIVEQDSSIQRNMAKISNINYLWTLASQLSLIALTPWRFKDLVKLENERLKFIKGWHAYKRAVKAQDRTIKQSRLKSTAFRARQRRKITAISASVVALGALAVAGFATVAGGKSVKAKSVAQPIPAAINKTTNNEFNLDAPHLKLTPTILAITTKPVIAKTIPVKDAPKEWKEVEAGYQVLLNMKGENAKNISKAEYSNLVWDTFSYYFRIANFAKPEDEFANRHITSSAEVSAIKATKERETAAWYNMVDFLLSQATKKPVGNQPLSALDEREIKQAKQLLKTIDTYKGFFLSPQGTGMNRTVCREKANALGIDGVFQTTENASLKKLGNINLAGIMPFNLNLPTNNDRLLGHGFIAKTKHVVPHYVPAYVAAHLRPAKQAPIDYGALTSTKGVPIPRISGGIMANPVLTGDKSNNGGKWLPAAAHVNRSNSNSGALVPTP